MDYTVHDSAGHKLAQGSSDNPYLLRNLLTRYIPPPPLYVEPRIILTTDKLRIWCSAELSPLLAPSPQVVNDESRRPVTIARPNVVGPVTTLASLCASVHVRPIVARRLLRKHFGPQHRKYEWPDDELQLVISIITG